MYDVVIVGAGASGLMLANILKKENKNISVLLLEKNDKVGKKLSITGNGKCNLGNSFISEDKYNMNKYYKGMIKYEKDYLNYLKSFGILLKEDKEGRIYPYNEQAISVCKMFEKNLKILNIEVKYNYNVNKIIKEESIFIINDDIKAKKVVIATGGMSYPKTGSTGDGYGILSSFGHNITKLYPSLVRLKTNYNNIKNINGVRANCNISLLIDSKKIKSEKGQVQFSGDFVSGICVFNLSRNVKKYLEENKKVELLIDFIPDFSNDYLKNYLYNFKYFKVNDILYGIINNKIADTILIDLKLNNMLIKDIKESRIIELINYVKNMKFNIVDTGDFNDAQVTNGGACLSEFDNDLKSTYKDDLYAIGEVLDVDGACGGYNLAWAFISSLIVANKILDKKNNERN